MAKQYKGRRVSIAYGLEGEYGFAPNQGGKSPIYIQKADNLSGGGGPAVPARVVSAPQAKRIAKALSMYQGYPVYIFRIVGGEWQYKGMAKGAVGNPGIATKTGWIPAHAVRIRKVNGKTLVDIMK